MAAGARHDVWRDLRDGGVKMVVTRAHVAEMARVSPALVSYVTNGGPRAVSPQARKRIEQAIKTLGYVPNTVAQALRGASTRTIGLLIPTAVNQFFGELATAVEKELFDSGNTLAVGVTNDDQAREMRYVDALVSRQVDGIMVISSHSLETLGKLTQASTPAIVLDRVPAGLNVSTVCVDGRNGAMTAVSHLQGHGHTIIGCLGGRAGTESADDRVAGWHLQQETAGLDHSARLVTRTDFTEQGGYDAAMTVLDRSVSSRPTALFVSSDIQTVGVLSACYELGLKVPEDISIVSFDGTDASRFAVPPLTSYRQPVEELARLAVITLLQHIQNPNAPTSHVLAAGELRVGLSCGCLRE